MFTQPHQCPQIGNEDVIDSSDRSEKEVIVGRFGLDLKKEKTQREIAIGISF
ncbi:hypothetical protein P4U97_10315 [Bacillus swezeyi]|uniref:hypothetical protein n=1 Tax=Bacillus swezeyi TaxID=1925020 RepID=UPI002E1EEF9F|nr:hypothetical protein [Bacillus swezeyi]